MINSNSTTISKARISLDIASSLAIVFLAGYTAYTLLWPKLFPKQPKQAVTTIDPIDLSMGTKVLRHDGAKIGVAEFSDFQCPFCGKFARDVFPRLVVEFIDKGLIDFSFHHFALDTLHPYARIAASASECAHDQGRFWEMHDRLFKNQQYLDQAALKEHAHVLTLDEPDFASCLAAAAPAIVDDDKALGTQLKITGTPSFLIGTVQPNGSLRATRRVSGTQSFEAFSAVINELLKTTS